MLILEDFNVVQGGLDWVGLHVTEEDDALCVSEGRIGRDDNPLLYLDDGWVDGGWYFEEACFPMGDTDYSLEFVIHNESRTVYPMIRGDTAVDLYDADEYDLLLLLAWRDDGTSPWHVAKPLREHHETYDS